MHLFLLYTSLQPATPSLCAVQCAHTPSTPPQTCPAAGPANSPAPSRAQPTPGSRGWHGILNMQGHVGLGKENGWSDGPAPGEDSDSRRQPAGPSCLPAYSRAGPGAIQPPIQPQLSSAPANNRRASCRRPPPPAARRRHFHLLTQVPKHPHPHSLPSVTAGAPAQQPNELWQPPSKGPPLSLDVSGSNTPGGSGTAWAPPVSCPSRLQHGSPARFGSAASFDPFAAAGEEPGCTPMPGAQPAAPPAVHRKASGSADDASPPPAAPRPAVHMADRIQSCPPERVGRRGSRPLTRIR